MTQSSTSNGNTSWAEFLNASLADALNTLRKSRGANSPFYKAHEDFSRESLGLLNKAKGIHQVVVKDPSDFDNPKDFYKAQKNAIATFNDIRNEFMDMREKYQRAMSVGTTNKKPTRADKAFTIYRNRPIQFTIMVRCSSLFKQAFYEVFPDPSTNARFERSIIWSRELLKKKATPRSKLWFRQELFIKDASTFLDSLERAVDKLNRESVDIKAREKFYEEHRAKFKKLLDAYEKDMKSICGRNPSTFPIQVECAESFEDAFHGITFSARSVQSAAEAASWFGRLIDERHVYAKRKKPGDKPMPLKLPQSMLSAKANKNVKEAFESLTKTPLIIDGKKVNVKVEPKKKGIFYDAQWPLKDYVFPHDAALFQKVHETLNEVKPGAGDYKWDPEHGPEHLMNALEYAERIVNIEKKKEGAKLNVHQIYLMIGFHDFWRACDIDKKIYHLGVKEFYSRKLMWSKMSTKSLTPEQKRAKELSDAMPDVVGGLASEHYVVIQQRVQARLRRYRKSIERDPVLKDAVDKTRINFTTIGKLMRQTMKVTPEHLGPKPGRAFALNMKIDSDLKTLSEILQTETGASVQINDLITQLLVTPSNLAMAKNLRQYITQSKDLPDIIQKTLIDRAIRIEGMVEDLAQDVDIKRSRTEPEIKILENTALKLLSEVESAFLNAFGEEEFTEKWAGDFKLIRLNILQRREMATASSLHMYTGAGDPTDKPLTDKKINPKYPVALFLDMLGYPFYYPDVMNFIKIHDFKYVTPETMEGKIAQDADLMDGIGPAAVERTYRVGLSFNEDYFLPSSAVPDVNKRFDYFIHGRLPLDTISVILVLAYCWPLCLNTKTAKNIVKHDQKVKKMEAEIMRFSEKEIGLTASQLRDLEDVMAQMKGLAQEQYDKMVKRNEEKGGALRMLDPYNIS